LLPTELVVDALAVVALTALVAAFYAAYHHWHGRGRLTADTIYHRQRAQLGFVVLVPSGIVLFGLVLLLSR
jgi:hypothetical protein